MPAIIASRSRSTRGPSHWALGVGRVCRRRPEWSVGSSGPSGRSGFRRGWSLGASAIQAGSAPQGATCDVTVRSCAPALALASGALSTKTLVLARSQIQELTPFHTTPACRRLSQELGGSHVGASRSCFAPSSGADGGLGSPSACSWPLSAGRSCVWAAHCFRLSALSRPLRLRPPGLQLPGRLGARSRLAPERLLDLLRAELRQRSHGRQRSGRPRGRRVYLESAQASVPDDKARGGTDADRAGVLALGALLALLPATLAASTRPAEALREA